MNHCYYRNIGLFLVLLLLCQSLPSLGQLPIFKPLLCSSPDLSPTERRALEAEAALALQLKRAGGNKAAAGITYVPIRPHIFRPANGIGGYSLKSLNNVMALTNSYYLKNGVGIQFFFAGTTPDYVDDDGLFTEFRKKTDEAAVFNRNVTNAMNQYYVDKIDTGIGGYAYFPGNSLTSTTSYIVNENNDEDMGRRLVPHELGHNFNLIHTFETAYGFEKITRTGGSANCSTVGDLLCDTPADPYEWAAFPGASSTCVTGCPSTFICSFVEAGTGSAYAPSPTNIMSYYFPCQHDFTQGQYDRIDAALAVRQSHTAYTLDYPPTIVNAPTNLTASSATGSVVLTWTDNANNEMGYFIERSTSPTDGFVPIGGVAPNITTFTDNSAPAKTQLYYRIRPSNTTTGALSGIASVVSPVCHPTFTGACNYPIGLTSFAFNAISMSQNTSCVSEFDGYSQYTAASPTVKAGQTYPFSGTLITPGYAVIVTIWADVDGNGLFNDSGELLAQPSASGGKFSGTLTIPTSATAGMLPLRVIVRYNNGTTPIPATDPCGTYNWGEAEDYQLLIEPTALTATLTASSASVCQGSPVTLSATVAGLGGTTYSLTVTNGTNSTTATGLSASAVSVSLIPTVPDAFTLLVLNSTPISASAVSESVAINALPTNVSLTSGTLTCSQTSVTLVATSTGGISYSLSDGQSNPGGEFMVNTPGIYTVIATNASGCAAVATASVSSDTAVITNASLTGGTLTCSQTSVTLVASSTAGTSYSLSDGQTSADGHFVVTTQGTYTVSISNASGCTASATATVGINTTPPSLTVTPSSGTLTCSQTSLTLTASGSFTGVRWNDQSTVSSLTVTAGGVYSVTATGANGCTATTTSVTISQDTVAPSVSSFSASSGTLTCSQTSVTLTASSSSTGTLSYRFSGPSGFTASNSTGVISVSVAGTYSVSVVNTITDCYSVSSLTVNQSSEVPVIASFASSGTLTCSQMSVTLTASVGGGVAPLSYTIAGIGLSSPVASSVASVSVAGTYSVTVSGSNGCISTTTVTVSSNTIAPSVSLVASGSINCFVSSVTLTANPVGSFTYVFGSGATQLGSSNKATVSSAGTYSVVVTGTNGCTAANQVTVSNSNLEVPLALSASSDAVGCGQSAVSISASTGATSYTLTGVGQSLTNTTGIFSVSVAGTYSVSATLGVGCVGVGAIVINSGLVPSASNLVYTPTPAAICLGKLMAIGTGTTFVFTGPNGYVFSNVFRTPVVNYELFALDVKATGTYTLTVSGGPGCATAIYTITVTDLCR